MSQRDTSFIPASSLSCPDPVAPQSRPHILPQLPRSSCPSALPTAPQSRPQRGLLTLEDSSLAPDQRPLLPARPLAAP